MKIIYYLVFMTLLTYACVERFEPEVGDYDSALVVDGLFSNSASPALVTLSRSFPYDEEEASPVSGASVMIEKEQGESHLLEEVEPGVYRTDPSAFVGEIGARYRLRVGMPDGRQFESTWEELKAAPPIREIRTVAEERIPDDPTLSPVPGMQFYLTTEDAEAKTRYYRWQFEETYQYGLRYPPLLGVEFGERPGNGEDRVYWLTGDEVEGGVCWKTEKSTRIIVATTENLTEDVVRDFPLHYVDNTTPRLYLRYSLLTQQYAISESYYEFLRKVQQINQTTGSLFDPIPNEVFGNMRGAEGDDSPVLGYFGVAGVTEERIFVDRFDLPPDLQAPFGPQCRSDTLEIDFRALYNRMQYGSTVLYDYHYNLFGDPIGFLVTQGPCARCAAGGATNQPPDFW